MQGLEVVAALQPAVCAEPMFGDLSPPRGECGRRSLRGRPLAAKRFEQRRRLTSKIARHQFGEIEVALLVPQTPDLVAREFGVPP